MKYNYRQICNYQLIVCTWSHLINNIFYNNNIRAIATINKTHRPRESGQAWLCGRIGKKIVRFKNVKDFWRVSQKGLAFLLRIGYQIYSSFPRSMVKASILKDFPTFSLNDIQPRLFYSILDSKYETLIVDSSYKVYMKLRIRNVTKEDFMQYKCVAKNSLGGSDGTITLYG